MCGIVGWVGQRGPDASALVRATGSLSHRGPDGSGILTVTHDARFVRDSEESANGDAIAALGHTRLSILDEQTSGQPFSSQDGRLAVVYNGEIYNFLELRRELERCGHRFRSTGDTEVLLAGYQQWGEQVVERLVGMWAFAIVDLDRRGLFLSRDRFGIKPLFFSHDQGALIFASEINALQVLASHRFAPNLGAIGPYLLAGTAVESEMTFFADVHRFPVSATAFVTFDEPHRLVTRRYWEPPDEVVPVGLDDAAQRFRTLFDQAVGQHLRSDVPTASCLSGGLDSSSIVMAAAKLGKPNSGKADREQSPHLAFGYCSDDDSVSERRHMEVVARAAGMSLIPVEASESAVRDALPDFLRCHDEPVASASALAQWFVFQKIHAEGIKVVLDGQGADEILGGYESYFSPRLGDLVRSGQIRGAATMVSARRRDSGASLLSPRSALFSLPRSIRHRAGRLRPALSRLRPRASGASLLRPSARNEFFAEQRMQAPGLSTFREARQRDLYQTRLPTLLRYEDTNSMAHSVEARVPFLDHRIVEFTETLPDDLLIRDGTTKFVMRQAFNDLLPSSIAARRDKIGFRASPSWTTDLISIHRSALHRNESELESRVLDEQAVADLMERAGESTSAEFLAWRVVNLKFWARAWDL